MWGSCTTLPLFRDTAQMETYFLWYACVCVNVCRTLIPYIHLVLFFLSLFRSQHLDIRTRSDFIIRRRSLLRLFLSCFFFSLTRNLYLLATLHRFQLNFYERMRKHKHLNGIVQWNSTEPWIIRCKSYPVNWLEVPLHPMNWTIPLKKVLICSIFSFHVIWALKSHYSVIFTK